VSLIFEALRKLEREKEAPDRGLVVVAPGAWGEGERPSRGRTFLAVALLVIGLGLGAVAWRTGARVPEAAAPAATVPAKAVAANAPALPSEPLPGMSAARDTASPPVTQRLVVPTAPPERVARDVIVPVVEAPASEPAEPELRLNAISTRDGQPVALLNDRLVREGDVVDGIRILRIGEDQVEVEWKGERRVLRF